MSVLALRHIERCLANLKELGVEIPAELLKPIAAFRDEYDSEDIQEARDVLEHEEDRVADVNLTKWPRFDGDNPLPRISGHKSYETRMSTITVLEKDYDVREVIKAALELEKPLKAFASQLYADAVHHPTDAG